MLAIFSPLLPNNNILWRANVVAGAVCSSVSSAVIEFATVPRRFIAHSRPNAPPLDKVGSNEFFFPRLRTSRTTPPIFAAPYALFASAEIIVYTLRTRVVSAPTNEKENVTSWRGSKIRKIFGDSSLRDFIYIYIFVAPFSTRIIKSYYRNVNGWRRGTRFGSELIAWNGRWINSRLCSP